MFYNGKHDDYSQIIVTMVKHCDDNMWKKDDDGAQYLYLFSLSLWPTQIPEHCKISFSRSIFVFIKFIYTYILY